MVKLLKQILEKWNLELEGEITNEKNKLDACEIIASALPSLQFGLNQRILSFTIYHQT